MKSAYDLAIAYRIYPKISKEPLGDFNNKIELARTCLLSFVQSLGNLRVKVWAILDGCPVEYEKLFQQVFYRHDLEIIDLAGVGNLATFQKQIEILSTQNLSDLVYFAEDDYLYLPNQLEKLVAFARANPACFITPYDHTYYYQYNLYQKEIEIKIFQEHHFRTAFSTCLTFLTSRQTLLQTEAVFQSYCRGNHDASVWFALTKPSVLYSIKLILHPVVNRLWLSIVLKAWRYSFFQIALGKHWRLWVPIPAVATHLDKPYVAPGVDWKAKIAELLEKQDVV